MEVGDPRGSYNSLHSVLLMSTLPFLWGFREVWSPYAGVFGGRSPVGSSWDAWVACVLSVALTTASSLVFSRVLVRKSIFPPILSTISLYWSMAAFLADLLNV